MNIDQLREACTRTIESSEKTGFAPDIALQLPTRQGAGDNRRLFKNRGPVGKVVEFDRNGKDIVLFNAKEILEFLINWEAVDKK